MLTPVELQNKTFKSGGLGYDKKDVEQFFREVTDEFARLYSENIDLKDKVDALNEALQRYKTMESTLQRALVLAEKTAEDTTQAAIQNARNIEKEAQLKSQVIMADARNELEHVRMQTMSLLQQFEKYKLQFKSLAAAQIELLESESYAINADRLEDFYNTDRPALSRVEEHPHKRQNRIEEKGSSKENLFKGSPVEERQQQSISRQAEGISLDSLEKDFGRSEEMPSRFARKQSGKGSVRGERSEGGSYWPDGRFPGRAVGKADGKTTEKKSADILPRQGEEEQDEEEFDFIDL
ncbi:MAG: DivIVA domain-containing protein [Lachnospiraceae bacterium]|nr:DivIVA domain-containing protein [Lachnospiraceae bacterium]